MENRLYLMDTRALEDPGRFSARYGEMPPGRKAKIDALRSEKAKRLSLAAGVLLQIALARAGAGEAELSYYIEIVRRDGVAGLLNAFT